MTSKLISKWARGNIFESKLLNMYDYVNHILVHSVPQIQIRYVVGLENCSLSAVIVPLSTALWIIPNP